MRNFKLLLVVAMLTQSIVYAQTEKKNAVELPVYLQEKPAVMISSAKNEFIIKLKSNPTTGYSWFLREYNPNLIEAVKHKFEATMDKKLMGAPGYELWTFRSKPAAFIVPQQTTIRFVYARPWESADNSTQVVFKVTTSPLSSK
jgi:inhibitor of cysteine peptidase